MAGTITFSLVKHQVTHDPLMKELVVTCIADSSDGSFPIISTSSQSVEPPGKGEKHSYSREIRGWFLSKISVNPGSPAPSVNSSLYLNDSNGVDILGGAGETVIHNSNSTEVRPFVKGFPYSQPITTALSIIISRNSVNSADIIIRLILTRNPY